MDYEWRIVAALVVSYAFIIWAAITFLRIFNSWMKRRRGPEAKKAKPLRGQALLDALEKEGVVEEIPGKPGVYRFLPGKDFSSVSEKPAITPNASSTPEAPGEPRIHPVGKGGTGVPAWRTPSSGSDENGKVAVANKSETDG